MPTGQFPWYSLCLHKFRPLQVEKLFGVYAGMHFPDSLLRGFPFEKILAAICSGRIRHAALATPPNLVRHAPALCLTRISAMRPRCFSYCPLLVRP